MGWRAALLLGIALAGCRSKPGDPCDRGTAACLDQHTELACQSGRFMASPCKGPSGCARRGSTVTCDVSANDEGDLCSTEDEGKGACTADGKAQIRCRLGAWQRTRCLGPEGCKPTAAGSGCDTSIAEEGDRCSGAGDACAVDGARLLTCIDGRYVPKFTCRGKAGCKDTGTGNLSCDLSVAIAGDACAAGGACSVDGKTLLGCKGGKFAIDRHCRGADGCKDDGSGNLTCDMSLAEIGDACGSEGAACAVDGSALLRCDAGRFVVSQACRCVVTGESVSCGGPSHGGPRPPR